MEVILLHMIENGLIDINYSFNPCFYGSYSFTRLNSLEPYNSYYVLILVFMEVILLQKYRQIIR